jgi:uncharacterized protein YndB with AHSA1/START domain
MIQPSSSPIDQRELILQRLIYAPPAKLFRAWTEPELMKEWFCPKPWGVSSAMVELRPGGSNLVVMRSPEGEEHPQRGVYLDVVQDRRIVFTDAFVEAWVPSEKPFFVVTITFEPKGPNGQQTLYTAIAQHWSVADKESHEKMGFHEGWGKATDQLAELVRRI